MSHINRFVQFLHCLIRAEFSISTELFRITLRTLLV